MDLLLMVMEFLFMAMELFYFLIARWVSCLCLKISIHMSYSCFSRFIFFLPFWSIPKEESIVWLHCLCLVLALSLNFTLDAQTKREYHCHWHLHFHCLDAQSKGENSGLKLKLSHRVYNLSVLYVCNHFVCRYQKGRNYWLMSPNELNVLIITNKMSFYY